MIPTVVFIASEEQIWYYGPGLDINKADPDCIFQGVKHAATGQEEFTVHQTVEIENEDYDADDDSPAYIEQEEEFQGKIVPLNLIHKMKFRDKEYENRWKHIMPDELKEIYETLVKA